MFPELGLPMYYVLHWQLLSKLNGQKDSFYSMNITFSLRLNHTAVIYTDAEAGKRRGRIGFLVPSI